MKQNVVMLSLQFKKDKRGGFSLGISVRGLIVYEVSSLQWFYSSTFGPVQRAVTLD